MPARGASVPSRPTPPIPLGGTPILTGLVWIAAALLALAGARKLADPAPASRALADLDLPSHEHLVRLLALVEIGLGGLLVVTGWWLAALTAAALYVGFAAFLAVGIRRGRLARGCGCLGASQGSATWSHVLVNLALAAVLVAAGTLGPALPLHDLGLTAPLTLALVTTAVAGVASIRALFVGGDATLGSTPHDPSSELT